MDPTTILAIICCAIVFAGWLVLPHSPAVERRPVIRPERERQPEPVRASA
jgi:hypothetical protein